MGNNGKRSVKTTTKVSTKREIKGSDVKSGIHAVGSSKDRCNQGCVTGNNPVLYLNDRGVRKLECGHADLHSEVIIATWMKCVSPTMWYRFRDCRPTVCALIAEFLGTMILTFVLAYMAASTLSYGPIQLIVMGLLAYFLLKYLVDTFKIASGAHLNPGYTFMTMMLRKTSICTGIAYIFTQLLAGIVGAAFVWLFFNAIDPLNMPVCLGTPVIATGFPVWLAFVAELFATAIFFVCIHYCVAHSQDPADRIGSCLGMIHIVLLFATGASVNFARYLGPYLVGQCWSWHIVLYFFANMILGPILAVLHIEGCRCIGLYDKKQKCEVNLTV
jgi:glycerol uptake facilitator-like aquaporin